MHATEHLKEADRLMVVCNSCRYCEGLCAVFPAMERRRTFSDGDLNYLANLCHACGACYVDCQFSPPHEFDVNVPRGLARVRGDSYRAYAWPRGFQPLFRRNGLTIALAAVLGIAGFVLAFVGGIDPAILFSNCGQFYRLMPHGALASLFGASALFAVIALVMGLRTFWRDIDGGRVKVDDGVSVWQAVKDVATLRYLDGGGGGCYTGDEKPTDRRRLFHHLTFYGFLLCFAATCAGTVYHYLLDMPAPYPWYQLPKLLGTLGGIGLVIGPAGLLGTRFGREADLFDEKRTAMDVAFLAMMFLAGSTGLLLMAFRQTPAMGILLAIHLGVVFSLFLTLPYGKFVHGLYRFAALVRHAMEQRPAPSETGDPA